MAILLCTCNGERFLAAQLDSIRAQSYPAWRVWASDDGSLDSTVGILRQYQAQWGVDRLAIRQGPARGFAANFLSLICAEDLGAEYYALADQDDVWLPDKLQRAVSWLQGVPRERPALYCGRTRLMDENGRELGCSPLFLRPPGFANALVQNIAGGNTMVFNEAARRLLIEAGSEVEVVAHDWWAYLVISGCGGLVQYDPLPMVCYRQHGANLIGANGGWQARLARVGLMLAGQHQQWNRVNLLALQKIYQRLTQENRRVLETWQSLQGQPLLSRLASLKRAGVYRQTLPGNLGLLLATVLRRI